MTEAAKAKQREYRRLYNLQHKEENKARQLRYRLSERAKQLRRLTPEGYAERIRKYRKKFPQKSRAWKAVEWAVKSGKMIRPKECSECHRECKPQAHHPDYLKPLEVVWLCRPCHLAEAGRTAHVYLPGDPL